MLKGKTAVITGSGRGIGKAISMKMAGLGANIVINESDILNKEGDTLTATLENEKIILN